MKSWVSLLSVVCLGSLVNGLVAEAKVPYPEIENLRKQTVVARVAIDQPGSVAIKKCRVKLNPTTLESKLATAQSGAAGQWAKITINTEDLGDLDNKSQNCIARASCQIYETFLKSARVEPGIQQEVEILREALDKKLKQMTKADYAKALSGIPKSCEFLKQVLR
jgi:hypothetical protein